MRTRLAIAGAIVGSVCALGLLAMRLLPSLAAAEIGPISSSSLGVPSPAAMVSQSERPQAAAAQNPVYDVLADESVGAFDWLPPGPSRCTRRDRRRYCDGPLRAPRPHGVAAARALRLGLGTRQAWFRALSVEAPVAEWLAAIPSGELTDTLLWPVTEGFLGRGFGQRLHGDPKATPHPGVDIPAAAHSRVRAAADGLVVYASDGRHGYGNVVMLLHRTGYVTVYAHCSALLVFPGQLVERGARIAEVGKTGLAHGNHLHFEWRRRGHARSPLRRLVERPDHATEAQLANLQRARRREAEARLAELRARAERNAARRARRAAQHAPTSPSSP
ncbi:MAG: M23 family metallopeptidase [Deltaproteobacteria bacterium]|nr:M23 family metallopeptidase [Deltaproteobacteria bacterium]